MSGEHDWPPWDEPVIDTSEMPFPSYCALLDRLAAVRRLAAEVTILIEAAQETLSQAGAVHGLVDVGEGDRALRGLNGAAERLARLLEQARL